jgi:hypothetical protein
MASAKERLRILREIIADAGDIANVDLQSELGKRLTMMDRQKIQMPMMPPPMSTPATPPQGMGQAMPPQQPQSQPPEGQTPVIDENNLNNPNQMEGQGSMNLP